VLNAIPRSWFSWSFAVLEGAQPVADIDVSWWREKGELTVQGSPYKVYREGVLSGAFILESAGSVLAQAKKPSLFRRLLILEHAGKRYTLQPSLGRKFLLFDGSGQLGSISPESIFTRRARVDLPADLPLPVRVFMIWLVVIFWKRSSDSAASAAALAAVAASS
jgi:hypothetical protein